MKEISPSILKALTYTRKATDKLNNKAVFINFFSEIVDLLMNENNTMAKEIYNILIDRGYISSVEEFYKLSRFEHNSDF